LTHKQQEQFKAMAAMIQGLVQQVTLLTSDVTILTDSLNEARELLALPNPSLNPAAST